jgi:hypothetical protein
MITTYIVDQFEPTDKTVKITFFNEEGFTHERNINIPHLENGLVDDDYFEEVVQGQLRGVEHKQKMGIIQFIDPNVSVGIGTTEAPIGIATT